ncbi:hypothetical protein Taro_038147 [Colocasia esculenta]|uniref:Protein kinase domain-containing protein n=1 Tax=Colocasia esculenta TaxID=4460 RepID=A0A843WEZ3_COLES|nr:hypothetical protein [Colocasia esculenta]
MMIRDVEGGGAGASPGSAAPTSLEDGVGPTMFRYGELAHATDNFNDRRKLGQGGFGAVYRGVLRGCEVAIKKIVREGDGEKSFMAEVKTIGQLNQKNLVRLLGWCRAGSRFFVVYEYMPNRSLDRHLFWSPPTDVDEGSRLRLCRGIRGMITIIRPACFRADQPTKLPSRLLPSKTGLRADPSKLLPSRTELRANQSRLLPSRTDYQPDHLPKLPRTFSNQHKYV